MLRGIDEDFSIKKSGNRPVAVAKSCQHPNFPRIVLRTQLHSNVTGPGNRSFRKQIVEKPDQDINIFIVGKTQFGL